MARGKERRCPAVIATATALIVATLTVGCASGSQQRLEVERQDRGETGERKKSWTGRSFAEQTEVALFPSPSATTPGWDQERVWGGSDDWEPAVAADPGAPYVYQLTTRYGGSHPEIIFRRSPDGGSTWEGEQSLGSNLADPMIEVATDGTIFAAGIFGASWDIEVTRSFDHGDNWTAPESVLGPGQPNWGDRPVLAISADGEDVYVAFNSGDSYVSSSHDGGVSFASPVKTSDDGRTWFHSAGAVAANGDVYFAAADYGSGYAGETNFSVLRSTDGGLNWTTTRIDTSAEVADCDWAAGCYLGFLGPSVALAVDVTGLVMIAYHAGDVTGEPQRMYVRTSTDGVVWSDRSQVSSTSDGVHNGFPALGASRTTPGDFRLVWQDDRNASQVAWNTWSRSTRDGGVTWGPAERLSDLGTGAPYKSVDGYAFVYGDYLEITVDGQDVNHVVWGESESYDGPGGTWYTRGTAIDCAVAVTGVTMSADAYTIAWAAAPFADAYDVVKGDLALLASSGGDFTASLLECLEEGTFYTDTTDFSTPTVGNGYYYLVRAEVCGGQQGTYDSDAASQIGSRDLEVAASLMACP